MSAALLRRLERLTAKRNTPDAELIAGINEARARCATYWGRELEPLTPETVATWPRTSEAWEAVTVAAWTKLGMNRP